ncbi:hypothetical protein ACODT3_40040 [Streptomyces sp. 4.24]|uniref:hypothetical protein n=1 Tax=Streptomyces tritrimontium TaxID=3406573 RepID=UPI003BB67599
MSRGLGIVQRRILEVLERVEEGFPGAWVLRSGLVTPKPGQKIERSDHSKTGRAVRTLAKRGLAESRDASYELGIHPVVRLVKSGRPTPLSDADEVEVRAGLHGDVAWINHQLRMLGSHTRVEIVDAEKVEHVTVIDLETRKTYRAVYIF